MPIYMAISGSTCFHCQINNSKVFSKLFYEQVDWMYNEAINQSISKFSQYSFC